MPRVPTYDQFQVAPQDAPVRFEAPLSAAAASIPGQQITAAGDAAQKLGGTLADITADIKKNVNEAAAKGADVTLSNGIRDLAYNPQTGFLNSKGKNAVDGYAAFQDGVAKLVTDSGKDLTDPYAKRMYSDVAQRRAAAALESAATHTAAQTTAYAVDQSTARQKSFTDDAAADPANAAKVAQAKAGLVAEANHAADLAGYAPDDDLRKQSVITATTGFHAAVLDTLMAQNQGSAARAYFDANKDEIDPSKRARFEGVVKVAGLKEDSAHLADTMIADGGSPLQQERTLNERFEKGEISVEVRDATLQRLEAHSSLVQQQQARSEQSTRGAIQDFFIRRPGASVTDLPATLYAEAKRIGYLDSAASLAKSSGKGEAVHSDLGVLSGLLQQAGSDPLTFASSFDPTKYADKLSRSDLERLTWAVGGINKRDAKVMASGAAFTNGLKALTPDIKAANIVPNAKPGTDQATQYAAFTTAFQTAIDEAIDKKGHALTPEEAHTVGQGLLAQGALSGTGIFSEKTKHVFELTPDEQPKFHVPYDTIPRATRLKIGDSLKRRNGGKQPMQDDVEREYGRFLGSTYGPR